ncbi:MAG: hypothetical protein PHI35_04245, partial [Victivallaceae bacterium]|nr:hypothetical protein [Victivallaceae bacterium]
LLAKLVKKKFDPFRCFHRVIEQVRAIRKICLLNINNQKRFITEVISKVFNSAGWKKEAEGSS